MSNIVHGKVKKRRYEWLRVPDPIWETYNARFHFTVDVCSSDANKKCVKHYTKETDGLKQDWTGERVWCHPLFDQNIPKWVAKASESKCTTVMLIPASTNAEYFHEYIYNKPNVSVEFLRRSDKKGSNSGWKFRSDVDNSDPVFGYVRPLMIVIFNNVNGDDWTLTK